LHRTISVRNPATVISRAGFGQGRRPAAIAVPAALAAKHHLAQRRLPEAKSWPLYAANGTL
jgi:hypothetical protein